MSLTMEIGFLQSHFVPPLIVIILIVCVYIAFYRKPNPPPFVYDLEDSYTYIKKQKKKAPVKQEKKSKSANTKAAAAKPTEQAPRVTPVSSVYK